MLILFEYYNLEEFYHLLIAFQQKLDAVGQEDTTYPYFHKGLDCILSRFKMISLSLSTDTRAVVEGVSYSYHNKLRYFTYGLSNS